jgi:hypothetical protein
VLPMQATEVLSFFSPVLAKGRAATRVHHPPVLQVQKLKAVQYLQAWADFHNYNERYRRSN